MSEGRSWKLAPATWALLAAAGASATWAQLDAREESDPRATLVSTRSAAWRVLPELANTASAGASIELWPAQGEPVRLIPEGLGHRVLVGNRVLGPADPEAVEGVWDSLRLATTLRAADAEGSTPGLGAGGKIVVELPQGGVRTVVLGEPTGDGVGLYGAIEGGVEGSEGLWVLEEELGVLVRQAPETWLARRAIVAEPADIVAVQEGELELRRGLDGLWRATLGEGSGALLDRVAVETRLDRLVSARLDPLVDPPGDPPGDDPGTSWITLEGIDGVDWSLRRHGTCPGRPDRELVSRGPGRWGCLDLALTEPWPVPGRASSKPGALLDPHLLPHAYGRVLRIELHGSPSRVLRRHGGGWRIEEPQGDRTTIFDVEESEVYRWYRALHEAEVELDESAEPWPEAVAVDLTLVTDSTATLRVRCTNDAPLRCRRDDGPGLVLRGDVPSLAFDVDAFAERRLMSVASEDVRAIEILPGSDASTVVRQSVHFDLGVWRLDAPHHPEADAALDERALEALLGTVGGLRAEAWVERPEGEAPWRRIRVERVPQRGQDPAIEVMLYEGCVVEIAGHRSARLGEGACEILKDDLLVTLPVERSLLGARGLELTLGDEPTIRLLRNGAVWADETGGPAAEANAWLVQWIERETAGLRRGARPSSVRWRLRILPTRGTAFVYEGGAGWLGVEGEAWFYGVGDRD